MRQCTHNGLGFLSDLLLARAQLAATNAEVNGARMSLRSAVVNQYLAVLQAQDNVVLAEARQKRGDEALRLCDELLLRLRPRTYVEQLAVSLLAARDFAVKPIDDCVHHYWGVSAEFERDLPPERARDLLTNAPGVTVVASPVWLG